MYDKTIKLSTDKTLGYQYFCDINHPLANKQGKIYYHRHVASITLGRWIETHEHVHHIDGDRANNHPNNLEVLTQKDHAHHHHGEVKPINCKVCSKSFKPDKPSSMYCSNMCSSFDRRVVTRPSKEELKKQIESHSFCSLGRKYGVSDNAVRKWARSYNLI